MAYVYKALKGKFNSTEYYLASMPFGEIARLTELPDERSGTFLLAGLSDMQREINWRRVKGEMKDYLISNDDAFFSSLSLFIVPLDLSPLSEGSDEHYIFRPTSPGSELGELELAGGNTFLFPGDGQHRAAAIREAIRTVPRMASERMPVVLIPFKHKDQVRQMFADLNRNAKPVSKTVSLGFETRDPLVVVAKRVAGEVALFRGRVNERSTSLPSSYPQVITMSALYESNRHLLAALLENSRDPALTAGEITPDNVKDEIADLRSLDPSADEVGEAVEDLVEVWNSIISALPGWQDVMDGTRMAGEIREHYVHAHGLGWQAISQASAVIIRSSKDDEDWLDTLVSGLGQVDWRRQTDQDMGNLEWQGIAVLGMRVNNTRESVRAAAGYILKKCGITTDTAAATSYISAYERLREAMAGPSTVGEEA